MPWSYSDKQLAALGSWAAHAYKKTDRLDPTRTKRLNELGFVWDPYGNYWEEMFGRLVAYKQQHGDCLVPLSYSDKQLANWVVNQRSFKNRGKLEPAREHQLAELGFDWKVRK